MPWNNLFEKKEVQKFIDRINNLNPATEPLWRKMNVAQMLSHVNVTYDLVYTDKYPRPGGLKKFMIKLFAKNIVVGPKPYKRNLRTAPEFLISGDREFGKEKDQLIAHLNKTQKLGASHFDGKESHAFGALSTDEWNTLFSKHLDHHLQQFGV